MDNKSNEQLHKDILERIKTGEVKMHSKSYFVLKSLLYVLATLFILVLAVFLTTFVFYVFKINGIATLPLFGLKGMRDFLLSLPWTLMAITLLFFWVSAVFLKQHSVTYRRPLIYAVGSLFIIFTAGTLLLVKTSDVRRSVYTALEKTDIPLVSDFYDSYKNVGAKNVTLGRIVGIYEGGMEIMSKEYHEKMFVAFGPQTSIYTDKEFEEGDYVIVHGRKNGHIIGAFVVERVRE